MSDGLDFSPPGQQARDNIIPRFYMGAVKNPFKSTQEGREIFDEREFVEILIPGDKNTAVNRFVKDEDKQRWAQQYQAFKAGQEAPLEGTPIEQWSAIGVALVMELKSVHIRTVDALAGLSDSQLAKSVPMGGHALRAKAQAFIAQAEKNAPTERLIAEAAAAREESADLRRQLGELAGQFADFKGKANVAA